MKNIITAFLLAASTGAACAAPAQQLACHYTYGGETKSLFQPRLANVTDAYRVAPTTIGSYFLFRPVFEPGMVKLYTYADHPDGPVLIHQASYPLAEALEAHGRPGFTGMQRVYEPIRDSELRYWCEIQPAEEQP